MIDNAIKYTKEGSVEIKLTKTNGVCKITVNDTGIGISDEYLPHLFDAFSQEEQGYTRRFEGNGLGLALVKKYCDIIDAVITVESEKNVGTKFTIRINDV